MGSGVTPEHQQCSDHLAEASSNLWRERRGRKKRKERKGRKEDFPLESETNQSGMPMGVPQRSFLFGSVTTGLNLWLRGFSLRRAATTVLVLSWLN